MAHSSRPSDFQLTGNGPVRLYSTSELLRLPPPTWMIDPILPTGALAALYGEPESGKSFVALDMAMCVASGLDWFGRKTRPGYVVYIGAEGGTGIGKRVSAWLKAQNLKPTDASIAWLIEPIPINVDSGEMAALLCRLNDEAEIAPDLFIIDTMARCFDGDENQQEDMGRFVAGTDSLRHAFGATVMVAHHTNLGGFRERGNTAFRGACDTMIKVTKEDTRIHLECTKQKDFEHFETIDVELTKVEGTDSCVIVGGQTQDTYLEQTGEQMLARIRQRPQKWADWRTACADISEKNFFKAFKGLKQAARVVKDANGLWHTQDR